MPAEKITGVVSFSLFGISAALQATDAREWGQVLLEMAPLLLIGFLAWSLWRTNKKHDECRTINGQLNEKIILLYAAMISNQTRKGLPSPTDFNENNFDLQSLVPQSKLPD